MKKVFSLVLAIILIFNFVSFSYADTVNTIDRLINIDPDVTYSPPTSTGSTGVEPSYDSGEDDNETPNLGIFGTIWNVFENIFNFVPRTFANIIYLIPTIDGIIFNTNNIFDITIFNAPNENMAHPSGIAGSLQSPVASVYNAFRYLVTAVYIVVLVYLAIRMMLSSIGRQKAKYKELFKYWLIGLLLLFSFHWVMAGVVWLSNTIVGILAKVALGLFGAQAVDTRLETIRAFNNIDPELRGGYPITNYIVTKILYSDAVNLGTFLTSMLNIFTGIAFIVLLLWSSLSIIVTYFKRLFTVLVLILLFPIVVLSYVFDKIGDRKAQTFSIWIKEFVTNVMIQPIHALILTFIAIILAKSSEIPFLSNNSFFAPIFCLLALRLIPMGEELLKKLFQISSQMGPGSRGIAGSMAQAGLALRGAKDMTRNLTQPLSNWKKRRDITQQHKDDYKNNLNTNRALGMSENDARLKASKDSRKALQKDLKAANVNSRTRSAMMAAGAFAGIGTAITGASSGQFISKALTNATLGSALLGGLAGVPKKVDEFLRGDATKAEDYNKRADELSKMDPTTAQNLSEEQKKKIAAELKIDIGRVNELLATKEGRKQLSDSYKQMGHAMQWGADTDKASKLTYLNKVQADFDKKKREGGFSSVIDSIDDSTMIVRNDGTYAKTKDGAPVKIDDYCDKSLKDDEFRPLPSQKGNSVQMAVQEYLKSDQDYIDSLAKVPDDKRNLSTKEAKAIVEEKRGNMEYAERQYHTALRKSENNPNNAALQQKADELKIKYDQAKSEYIDAQEISSSISDIRTKEKNAKKVLLRDDEHFNDKGFTPTYTETAIHSPERTEIIHDGEERAFSIGTQRYVIATDTNTKQRDQIITEARDNSDNNRISSTQTAYMNSTAASRDEVREFIVAQNIPSISTLESTYIAMADGAPAPANLAQMEAQVNSDITAKISAFTADPASVITSINNGSVELASAFADNNISQEAIGEPSLTASTISAVNTNNIGDSVSSVLREQLQDILEKFEGREAYLQVSRPLDTSLHYDLYLKISRTPFASNTITIPSDLEIDDLANGPITIICRNGNWYMQN